MQLTGGPVVHFRIEWGPAPRATPWFHGLIRTINSLRNDRSVWLTLWSDETVLPLYRASFATAEEAEEASIELEASLLRGDPPPKQPFSYRFLPSRPSEGVPAPQHDTEA